MKTKIKGGRPAKDTGSKKGTEIMDNDGVMLDDREATIESFNFQTELNPELTKPVGHFS